MIMNHRPTNVIGLDTVVEELAGRIPDEAEQAEIVQIIKEVLGSADAAAQREEMKSAAQERANDAQASREQMVVDEDDEAAGT